MPDDSTHMPIRHGVGRAARSGPADPSGSVAPGGPPHLARWWRVRTNPAFGPLVGLIIAIAVFRGLAPGMFTSQEVSGATSLGAAIGIIAVGAGFLMISGEFDLSVATVFALAQVVWGILISDQHIPPLLGLLYVLLIGAGVGLVNGVVTVRFRIPSFIVTLATFLAVGGVALIVSGGNTIEFYGHSAVVSALGAPLSAYLSVPVIWWAGLTIVGWFVLERTRYGNWCRGTGANRAVAYAMGVPVLRLKISNFVACSVLAAFAGCVEFASYGSASASNGSNYELYAIVAAVIGGTSLFGGVGSMIGIFIGSLIVGLLETGLVLIGVPGDWYQAAIGGVLVLAAIANEMLSRQTKRGRFGSKSFRELLMGGAQGG